ncbi:sugar ABC transporter substrate-binding protein [Lapillicoccus sp.]|uniref:sugar ABC transporter substrate-binding protein n=1 Tax=Lapillicoccus sp. TaxID=1909287 RepID=UPI00344EF709
MIAPSTRTTTGRLHVSLHPTPTPAHGSASSRDDRAGRRRPRRLRIERLVGLEQWRQRRLGRRSRDSPAGDHRRPEAADVHGSRPRLRRLRSGRQEDPVDAGEQPGQDLRRDLAQRRRHRQERGDDRKHVLPEQRRAASLAAGQDLAINQHYDGVALVCGIDPAALAPQMQAAKAAGIKVIDVHLADVSKPASALIAGQTDGEFNRAMRLGVASALVRAKGKAIDSLVITSNENPPSAGMGATVQSEFAKYCTACKVESINVSIPDWSTKMTGAVTSALVRNPDIKAVFTVYDAQTPFVLPAIKSSHRDAMTYGFGLTPEVAPLMAQPGNLIGTDMGPNDRWMSYTASDQLFRVMAGQPPIEASKAVAPYRLFTPDNVSEFVQPTFGFGDSFIAGFRALWQKAPAS